MLLNIIVIALNTCGREAVLLFGNDRVEAGQAATGLKMLSHLPCSCAVCFSLFSVIR